MVREVVKRPEESWDMVSTLRMANVKIRMLETLTRMVDWQRKGDDN